MPAEATCSAIRTDAGALSDGTGIEAVTLSNARGVSARILTYGAALQALVAPGSDGALADLVLGHDDVEGYEATRGFLGVTIGRYANRIAHGRIVVDGTAYALARNDGDNTLHGGARGFDRVAWEIVSSSSGATASVTLRYISPDGDGGFPGELTATVTYSLNDDDALTIAFAATTTRPTVVSMTNHALFNLAGEGAPDGATQHRLTVGASAFTPIDRQLIPTGEIQSVEGTAFDFRHGRRIADGLRDGHDAQIAFGRGYDHNFVLDKGMTAEPQFAARLEDPNSGRRVDVLTTEPGLQLYSANAFDGRVRGKRGHLYRMGDGIALEPQKFPDTPNQPSFGSARLDPGQVYRHTFAARSPGNHSSKPKLTMPQVSAVILSPARPMANPPLSPRPSVGRSGATVADTARAVEPKRRITRSASATRSRAIRKRADSGMNAPSATSASPVGRLASQRMRQPKIGWSSAERPLAAR